MDGRIRPIALALIRRGGEILLEEGRDESESTTFFRPLGGTIEFGETGAEAVRRELHEELGAEIEVERFAGALENLFTWNGEPGHEIALVYACRLRDERLRSLDAWEAREPGPAGVITHRLAWKRLEPFRAGREILYPEGFLALADEPERGPAAGGPG